MHARRPFMRPPLCTRLRVCAVRMGLPVCAGPVLGSVRMHMHMHMHMRMRARLPITSVSICARARESACDCVLVRIRLCFRLRMCVFVYACACARSYSSASMYAYNLSRLRACLHALLTHGCMLMCRSGGACMRAPLRTK